MQLVIRTLRLYSEKRNHCIGGLEEVILCARYRLLMSEGSVAK